MKRLTDSFKRKHDYLRISLTDRCNLSCLYCNPDNSAYAKLLKQNILTFDELLRLIKIFGGAEIRKIRFTGGEPLARKDVFDFLSDVKKLKDEFNFEIGITTNATLLNSNVHRLKEAGIERLNFSLDSLQKEKFYRITKQDKLNSVLDAIREAKLLGFSPLKINSVVIKGINDDELIDFVNFAVNNELNIRFIEFMPFGNNDWSTDAFMGWQEMKSTIDKTYNLIPVNSDPNSVAKDFIVAGTAGKVSFISSISDHFCSNCNRLRITASGKLKLCLFTNGNEELNFKELLNDPEYTDEDIIELVSETLIQKKEMHRPIEEILSYDKNQMLSIGG
jgi:cyclic pyranopterin phosphate synthase